MVKRNILFKGVWFLAAIILLFFMQSVSAREKDHRLLTSFNKPTAIQSTRTLSDINNWTYWMQWDGQSGRDPITGASGGFYPGNTLTSTIFADGFIWAGITTEPNPSSPALRAGGSSYISGAVPGYISASGNRVTPDQDERIRIYRIRADWRTLTPSQVRFDAAVLNNTTPSSVSEGQIQEIIDQYKADWIDWPASELGAPYVDVNGNGVYDPVRDGDGAPIAREGDHPGIANADQVIWFVANDFNSSQTNEFLGAEPLGLEYQVTAWSYNQKNARLGQIIFKKYKFVNKSEYDIDSMYVSQWSDPDLGNFGDDVVGCDSTLSLGFVWNGGPSDDQYSALGLAPAAAGYDFFQGPIVFTGNQQDTAVFDLQKVSGAINLPMTSFAFFAAGDPVISDPPLGDYNGTLGWYNLLRGFLPTFDVNNPTPFRHRAGPAENNITKFPLNGDPVANTGDLDGQGNNLAPGDRRLLLNSGPFELPVWVDDNGDGLANYPEVGVQEIVVALIGGLGNSYTASVDQVKLTDRVAQQLYDDLFETVPKPPVGPQVEFSPFRESISLYWGADTATVSLTESDNPFTGYNFEGYNVYQFPSSNATLDQATKIATFDKVNGVTSIKGKKLIPQTGREEIVTLQAGSDNGIQRHFTIERNYITGQPLFPGNTYYFAVTAYNFNDFVDEFGNPTLVLIEDSTLESSATILEIVPQDPNPGEILPSNNGDLLTITHTEGGSDGIVQAKVIDPMVLTGDSYEVFFEDFQYIDVHILEDLQITMDTLISQVTGDTIIIADTTITLFPDSVVQTATGWNVRSSDGVVVSNQFQASNIDDNMGQPIIDGIEIRVSGPPLTLKDWDWVSGDASPLYPGYSDGRWISGEDWGGAGLFGGLGMAHIFWGGPPGIAPADFPTVEIRFTHMTNFTDTNGDGEYTFDASGGEPYFFDVTQGQKAFMYQGFGGGLYLGFNDIPFQAWDVESDPPRQLNVIVRDRDQNGQWDQGTGGGPYNYVWIMADDYDDTGTAWDASTPAKDFMGVLTSTNTVPAYYVLWGIQRGSRPFLAESGVLSAVPNKVITTADKFAFQSNSTTFSNAKAQKDVEKINVFPNPYYAHNPLEQNRFNRFVKFSHLPEQATLRIFNLAGSLVRTLEKDSETQFLEWDLRNESNFPVASGLYIVHIDMPELGKEKVLKLFIIQGDEILRFF